MHFTKKPKQKTKNTSLMQTNIKINKAYFSTDTYSSLDLRGEKKESLYWNINDRQFKQSYIVLENTWSLLNSCHYRKIHQEVSPNQHAKSGSRDDVIFEESRQDSRRNIWRRICQLPLLPSELPLSYRYFQFCSADNLSSICG